jgi:hypothetical protein
MFAARSAAKFNATPWASHQFAVGLWKIYFVPTVWAEELLSNEIISAS